MKRRVITLRPELIDVPTGRVGSYAEAGMRSRASKQNTSSFFTTVYNAIRSGRIHPIDGGYRYFKLPFGEDGELRTYRPDISHSRKTGRSTSEIKAVSTRNAQPACGQKQAEGYIFHLLKHLDEGDKFPYFDYVFFRYGDWKLAGQHKYLNGNLMSLLAESVRDMLISPPNLTMFLFLNSSSQVRDQETSESTINERAYWRVSSRGLTYLHKLEIGEAARKILDYGPKRKLSNRSKKRIIEDFFIDDLIKSRPSAPEMQTTYKTRVRDFQITKYRLPNDSYAKWLEHFSENHHRILTRRLGIRDLFQEWKDNGGKIIYGRKYNSANDDCPF